MPPPPPTSTPFPPPRAPTTPAPHPRPRRPAVAPEERATRTPRRAAPGAFKPVCDAPEARGTAERTRAGQLGAGGGKWGPTPRSRDGFDVGEVALPGRVDGAGGREEPQAR